MTALSEDYEKLLLIDTQNLKIMDNIKIDSHIDKNYQTVIDVLCTKNYVVIKTKTEKSASDKQYQATIFNWEGKFIYLLKEHEDGRKGSNNFGR